MFSPAAAKSFPSKSGIDASTFPIIGIKLPVKNVTTVSPTCFNSSVTSSPIAIFPSRFLNAAFMDAKDPDSVVAASFAVVPVIPSSPCIT